MSFVKRAVSVATMVGIFALGTTSCIKSSSPTTQAKAVAVKGEFRPLRDYSSYQLDSYFGNADAAEYSFGRSLMNGGFPAMAYYTGEKYPGVQHNPLTEAELTTLHGAMEQYNGKFGRKWPRFGMRGAFVTDLQESRFDTSKGLKLSLYFKGMNRDQSPGASVEVMASHVIRPIELLYAESSVDGHDFNVKTFMQRSWGAFVGAGTLHISQNGMPESLEMLDLVPQIHRPLVEKSIREYFIKQKINANPMQIKWVPSKI